MMLASSLASVAKIRNLKTVKQLLAQAENSIAKAEWKRELLKRAAEGGTLQVFTYLVEKENADTSQRYGNEQLLVLHIAALYGQLRIVRYLIDSDRTMLHCVDNKGRTPLQLACRCGHAQIASLLLKAGADVEEVDVHGDTAIHYCSFYGYADCLKRLIKAGGDPTRCNKFGVTALHFAAHSGQLNCVQYLIKCAPSLLHAHTSTGQLAMHKAAQGGHICVLKALIGSGSDPNCGDGQGKTPLKIAEEQGHLRCIQYLISFGISCFSSPSQECEYAGDVDGAGMGTLEPVLSQESVHDDQVNDSQKFLLDQLHKVQAVNVEMKQELLEYCQSNEQLQRENTQLWKELKKQELQTTILKVKNQQLTHSLMLAQGQSQDIYTDSDHESLKSRPSSLVTEAHILTMSRHVGKKWKNIARRLGIPEAEIENTESDHIGNQREQGYQVLISWMKREGKKATKEALLSAFNKEGCAFELAIDS